MDKYLLLPMPLKVGLNIVVNCNKNYELIIYFRFMKNTHMFIKEKQIKIISARHNYQALYPGDYRKWKVAAFLEINHLFKKDVSLLTLPLFISNIRSLLI